MIRALIVAGAAALAVSTDASAQRLLFVEPLYEGTAGHFSAAGQANPWNPKGIYYLHANQAPPEPTSYQAANWDVGALTGLECPSPSTDQLGIGTSGEALPGHTAAQICGGVGAYMDSADLYLNSPGQRMMITPEITFDQAIQTFPAAASTLAVELHLQVPTATNTVLAGVPVNTSNCYVAEDMLFLDATSGGRLSLSVGLFGNGTVPLHDGSGFDSQSDTAIANGYAEPWSKVVTWVPGTALYQAAPWRGSRQFVFTVSQAQFAAAIALAQPRAQAYGRTLSTDPANYLLTATHLNAELHYTATMPTTLGWSMWGLAIVQLH